MTDSDQANGETLGGEQTEYRRCECGLWMFQVGSPEDEDYTEEETGCTRTIPAERTFAQGHDAKLKSLLIDAGIAGLEVGRTVDGITTWMGAPDAAARFGFGHQVWDGIQNGKQLAEKRAERKAARDAKKTEKALAKVNKGVKERKLKAVKDEKKIKVGRWVRTVIEETAGTYVYIDSKGQEQQVAKSKAKVVA